MQEHEETHSATNHFELMLNQIKSIIESEGKATLQAHKTKNKNSLQTLEKKINEYEILCGELKRINLQAHDLEANKSSSDDKDLDTKRAMMQYVLTLINDDQEEKQKDNQNNAMLKNS